MSNYATGHAAERRAARYLEKLGYQVCQLNWRTRWCEIDVVAEKSGRIYLVEVKYRRRDAWGAGYNYITPRKLAQMDFAARCWQARHSWQGDIQLAVMSINGSTFRFDLLEA